METQNVKWKGEEESELTGRFGLLRDGTMQPSDCSDLEVKDER